MTESRVTHTSMMVLQAIDAGYVYGLSMMEATGLPSGTIYPLLRRLQGAGLVRSSWEAAKIADAEQRPARKYYKLTSAGAEALEAGRRRFPFLAGLKPATTDKK